MSNLLEADFSAPEIIRETVITEMAAREVRKGDVVKGHTIAETKSGPKWTYLRNANGKLILEVGSDVVVEVSRQVETKDSVAAQTRSMRNRAIAQKLSMRANALASAQVQMNDELNKYSQVSYSALTNLLEAQANLKVWNQFAGAAASAEDGQDLVDVKKELIEYLTTRLVQNVRALSRSTSVTSNLIEDCDREAMGRFIEDSRWSF